MNEWQATLMYSDLPRLLAKKQIQDRNTQATLDPESIRNLYLTATGDEKIADKVYTQALMQMLKEQTSGQS